MYFQECPRGQLYFPLAELGYWVCYVLPFLLWLPFVTASTQEVAWGTLTTLWCLLWGRQTKKIVLQSPQSFWVSAQLVRKAIYPILGLQAALLGLRIAHKINSQHGFSSFFSLRHQLVKDARLEAGDFYIIVNSTNASHPFLLCCLCYRGQ